MLRGYGERGEFGKDESDVVFWCCIALVGHGVVVAVVMVWLLVKIMNEQKMSGRSVRRPRLICVPFLNHQGVIIVIISACAM